MAIECQNKPTHPDKLLDIAIGINFNVVKSFNNAFITSLKQKGLPAAALNKATFSFGSNIYLSNINSGASFIGIIGTEFLNQRESDNGITMNAKSFSNDFNVGYIAWKHSSQYFLPEIGIGWSTSSYHFSKRSALPVDYDQALQSFTGERDIHSGGLVYLNLTANYNWELDKSNEFLLGLRANYHLGLNRKNMELTNGYGLPGSPVFKANSLSIGVSIIVQ